MALETWLAFAAASIILLVIPGPTILTVISYSLANGRRANVPLVVAVTLGDSRFNLAGSGLLTGAGIWALLAKRNGVGG